MAKPTNELKSTPFTEVIELERIVTPDEEKRVDHIFVRRKKICTRHPEGFATEEICLLYTSPSPRDMPRSRMPSSA